MGNVILLTVIYLAFISLGLPDGVFGVAWPSMRLDFGMPLHMAGIITIILLSCSAFSSFMSGKVLRRFGTGTVTFISCLLTGVSLLGYSQTPTFIWLAALAIPLGIGQGAVDSGLNNYVANNYSSRHMSWLHCFWGLGATLGPFIMTKTLAADKSWRQGYSTIAFIQIALAAILLISLKLWKKEKQDRNKEAIETSSNIKKSTFKSIAPWIGIFIFFIYSGTEFSVGLWANSMLIESRNIPKATAGIWISYYYGSLMIGRFITGIIVNKLGNRKLVRMGLLVGITGVLLVFIPSAPTATMIGLMFIGLGFAPIYPCMMHETPRRFDEETSNALIGFQVGAACIGGSIISGSIGIILSKNTLEALVPCLGVLLLVMFTASEYLNKRT
jgi:fucose permease